MEDRINRLDTTGVWCNIRSESLHTHNSDAGNAASSGTRVFAGGSGNNDEYFFDYQSGVVHFIGTNLPNGVNFSGKTVYVCGARYSGTLGLQNNVANTGDITFTGSTLSAPSNADMTFDNSGTGQYIFEGTTSLTVRSTKTPPTILIYRLPEGVLTHNFVNT